MYAIFTLCSLILLIAGCAGTPGGDGTTDSDRVQYLQDLGASGYDLIIMDYSQDGSDERAYDAGEIALLKAQSNALVVSYLSLGVAETNRYYWNPVWDANSDGLPDSSAPSWLVRESPAGSGKWTVKYWDSEWKRILLRDSASYLAKLLRVDYDGAYLTGLEAWQRFPELSDASSRMKNLVVELCDTIHARESNFFTIALRCSGLSRFPDFVAAVDAVAQDEMFVGYNGSDGVLVPYETRNTYMSEMAPFGTAGKLRLAIDFPFEGSSDRAYFEQNSLDAIAEGRNAATAYGMLYYPVVRNYNDLTIIPGGEPVANTIPIRSLTQVQEFCIQLRPSRR
ncbi:MAG: endo alpha-1,4 polygalactosaminidase [bacterium]|nr:endo alpha-1,4 polygalactosaminidase [bacterium]